MAVEQQKPQLVKDFWPSFNKGVLFLVITIQAVVLLLVASILYLVGLFEQDPVVFGLALGAQAAMSTIASIIIYRIIAQPIKNLMAAITHIAGEPTDTTPPNPNDPKFQKTGFRVVLQTLYQIASKEPVKEQPQVASNSSTAVEQKPEASQTLLEAALNETICGFVVMNHEHKIIYANKAAPIDVGQDGESSLRLIFNGDDTLDTWLAECEQSSVHAEKTWARIPDKLADEEDRRFFDVLASYDKGAEAEVVISLVDRTNLYKVGEQELDFIAFAAHELRGPITVIRGYLDVLESELGDKLEEDHHELFRRLTVSANRLSGYINNILNTSRYDRRHLKMHLTETSLAQVYDTIRDDMQLRASAQNRVLTVTIPTDLPTIAGDIASLSEVFGNLIDNAIKYSNEGGTINVTGSVKGDMVELAVEDHGIGMPGSVVSNLFQKFYRSHRSRETVAGTGIGLYISKAIVESHGGTISVRSEEGKGSTFIVSIPNYQSVADKLKAGNNSNEQFIDKKNEIITNHSMYRG